MPTATRSLETMVLQAHRAKGTWYSYALRQGEVTKTSPKVIEEHAKHLKEIKEAAPGGRTYI
ncbi:unnamed protein product [Alternaria sp. RS040]